MKYKFLSIVTAVVILLLTYQTNVLASEINALECIEQGGKDCLDNSEQAPQTEDNKQETPLVGSETMGFGAIIYNIIKMVFALFIVIALIYVALNLVKKRNSLYRDSQVLENLGGIALGQQKSIQIVRIGNRHFLIGVGENVQLLEEITDDETIEQLIRHESQSSSVNIMDSITNVLTKTKNQKQKNSSIDFTNQINEELIRTKNNRKNIINDIGED